MSDIDIAKHPSDQLIESIIADSCRESVWLVVNYVDGQMALTDFYSLELTEVPPSNHTVLALWAMMKLGAQA